MYAVGCLVQIGNRIYHIAGDVEYLDTDTMTVTVVKQNADMPFDAISTGQCSAFKIGNEDGKAFKFDVEYLSHLFLDFFVSKLKKE